MSLIFLSPTSLLPNEISYYRISEDWFTFIFRFHKADTIRQLLPLIHGICVYSGIIAWLNLEYWKLSENN